MSVHPNASDSGYSPSLHIELHVHGQRFAVAEIGSSFVRLRDAVAAPAGPATVRVEIDGRPLAHRIELFDGIDPQRRRQPSRPLLDATIGNGPMPIAGAS